MTVTPFSDPITAGGILVQPEIRSPNFVTGVSGWDIRVDGTAEFNDLILHGGTVVISSDLLQFVFPTSNGVTLIAPSGDPTGATDFSNIATALSVPGANVWLMPGTFITSATIRLTQDGSTLQGSGAATVMTTGTTWGGGTSPAVQVLARDCTVSDMKFGAIDGWGLQLLNQNSGGGHQVNHQCHFSDLWFEQGCAGGLLVDGQQDTVGLFLRGIHTNRVGGGTAGNLDAIRFVDCSDIDGTTGAASIDGTATSGHGIRFQGAVANVRLSGMDCGGFPTPAVGSGQAASASSRTRTAARRRSGSPMRSSRRGTPT